MLRMRQRNTRVEGMQPYWLHPELQQECLIMNIIFAALRNPWNCGGVYDIC